MATIWAGIADTPVNGTYMLGNNYVVNLPYVVDEKKNLLRWTLQNYKTYTKSYLGSDADEEELINQVNTVAELLFVVGDIVNGIKEESVSKIVRTELDEKVQREFFDDLHGLMKIVDQTKREQLRHYALGIAIEPPEVCFPRNSKFIKHFVYSFKKEEKCKSWLLEKQYKQSMADAVSSSQHDDKNCPDVFYGFYPCRYAMLLQRILLPTGAILKEVEEAFRRGSVDIDQ